MRRRRGLALCLCAAALAAALAAFGCAGGGRARAAPPAATWATPLFWHAQSPGGGGFYLLGSVHIRAVDAPAFGPEIEQAYRRSDAVVVEVDVSHVTPADVESHTQRYATLPPHLRLDALLAPETRKLLARYVESRGLPADPIQRFKPWFVAQLILVTELEAAGYDAALGVDRGFIDQASGEKTIVGLETIASQLAVLDGLSPEIQELMLKDTLLRIDELAGTTAKLMDAWSRGDEAGLEQQIFEPLEETPEFEAYYDALIWQRNVSMAARLVELARDGQTRFVVLGAGHMLGAKGIPALLVAQGFVVERVRPGEALLSPDVAAPPP